MMNNSTIEALKAMRFSAMAAEFERQLGDPAAYSMLGFEERFALMVDAEWNRRQQNRLARCIREAHFAAPGAMIEDIEYHEDRRLDKTQILRFATCKYIEDGHHIILKGASGSGKTFLACAFGNAACRKYKSVRYIRLPELLEELSLAQASGELKKLIKSYRKYDLLILDEWLIRCLRNLITYWRLLRCAATGGRPSSVPNTTRMNGTSALILTLTTEALFLRLLWTASSTMPMRF